MAGKKAPAKKVAAKKKPVPRTKAGTSKEAAATRRQRFIEAYIANGGNATQAAEAAGYSPGPSARVQGCRLLADPNIAAAVAGRAQEVTAKYELTTDLVIRSIVQELTFDPAKLYGKDGQLLPVTELPEDVRMALSSVEFEQAGSPEAPVYVRKVKWAARQAAREQAMKHLGMFREDNNQRNPLAEVPRGTLKALVERLGGRV